MKLTKEEKQVILELYKKGPSFIGVDYHEEKWPLEERVNLAASYGNGSSLMGCVSVSVTPKQFDAFITLRFNGEFVACLKQEYFDMVTEWEREKIREADEFVGKELEKLDVG